MSNLPNLIEELSQEFDELCQKRHLEGAEKYGPGKFLNVDVMQEAIYEVADLANYARYAYIKIRLIQEQLLAEDKPDFQKEMGELE